MKISSWHLYPVRKKIYILYTYNIYISLCLLQLQRYQHSCFSFIYYAFIKLVCFCYFIFFPSQFLGGSQEGRCDAKVWWILLILLMSCPDHFQWASVQASPIFCEGWLLSSSQVSPSPGNCSQVKGSSLALDVMLPLLHANDQLTGVETKRLGPCFKVGPTFWCSSCSRAPGRVRLSQTPFETKSVCLAFFSVLPCFPFSLSAENIPSINHHNQILLGFVPSEPILRHGYYCGNIGTK